MEEYPVDVAPVQLIRWFREEEQRGPGSYDVSASLSFEAIETGDLKNAGISEETDIDAVTAVGLVEIRPAKLPRQWLIRVRAEDSLGDRIPEDHSVSDDAEAIDLETFEALFLAPKRATLDATLFAETPQVRARAERILDVIMSDRHSG